MSAVWPSEVHTFWPLTIHSSPSLTARVGEAGEVGAGARLAEQLAPGLLAGDDVADVEVDLLLGAVGGDGRARRAAGRARRARRAAPNAAISRLDAHGVAAGQALAVGVGRAASAPPSRPGPGAPTTRRR